MEMIDYQDALNIVLERVARLEAEAIPIDEAAGCALSEALVSRDTIPNLRSSDRDGYAVRTEDVKEASEDAPVTLEVIDVVPAGKVSEKTVGPGQAIQTMTGAPVTEGADAIVMVEYTEVPEEGKVLVKRPAERNQHLRPVGSDITEGDTVLPAGTVMGPAQIGVAATCGFAELCVYRRPVVAVLATGDEIIDVAAQAAPGKVRNANTYSLMAQIRRMGAIGQSLGHAPDSPDRILATLESALDSDLFIISGGASVGEFDFIDEVLQGLGAVTHFDRVAVKPGKPVTFATLGPKVIFGLPGNPVSSMVSFELFCRPALRKMMGHTSLELPRIRATLAERVTKKPARRDYQRCILSQPEPGRYEASLSGVQRSFVTSGAARANGLLLLEKGLEVFEAGSEITVLLTDDLPEATK